MPRDVGRRLDLQAGVIARRQALESGLTRIDVDKMVRRGEWVRMLPGVYVSHTGCPTWQQRAWAGVLYYWPAALAGASAMRATVGPRWRPHDDAGPICVAVAAARHVHDRAGYRVRWLAKYDGQVLMHTHPPRMRIEEACLDLVIATPSKLDRVQVLADACQSRRTTPQRLLTALAGRSRVPDRSWIDACSATSLRAPGRCSNMDT
jgi:hypothetical protein